MKKILTITSVLMFLCAIALPTMAENPPKNKEKAKTTQTASTEKSTDKKSDKKCSGSGSCCADKDKATTKK